MPTARRAAMHSRPSASPALIYLLTKYVTINIMAQGKQTCRILKEIRQQITKANDIELVTSECRYKGDCLGTCPKCEAEVRYLEQQLRARRRAGKAVTLAGISMSALSLMAPVYATAQTQSGLPPLAGDVAISKPVERVAVKGQVFGMDDKTEKIYSPLSGAIVRNLDATKSALTDVDGNFEIEACRGDSIEFSYIGYDTQTISVTDTSSPLNVMLKEDEHLMGEVLVLQGAVSESYDRKHVLDLYVVDENKEPIDLYDIWIERIYLDEDGEEVSEELNPSMLKDKHLLRLYWSNDWGLRDENGKPLKEATLRIEADGYEDVVDIKVKYPKRRTRKTIQFKHKME